MKLGFVINYDFDTSFYISIKSNKVEYFKICKAF